MDFVTYLPKTKTGYDALLIMVDYVTKMMVLRPTYSAVITVDTTRLFVDSAVRAHGLARVIVSERDTKFTSHFRKEVHRVMGTTLAMSSGFHPPDRWPDGESQPVNRGDVESLCR